MCFEEGGDDGGNKKEKKLLDRTAKQWYNIPRDNALCDYSIRAFSSVG